MKELKKLEFEELTTRQKLGMTFKMGGHIFERILNPDRKTENGNSFWDEHNDWYGIELLTFYNSSFILNNA